MGIMDNLQSMLSQTGLTGTDNKGLGALSNLLAPAALGGLVGALMSSKTARKYAGNAVLLGGGAAIGTALWKYMQNRNTAVGQTAGGGSIQAGQAGASAESSLAERATRLIRALVFAAKSDGHIDAKEQEAIEVSLKQLNLGPEVDKIVQEALTLPLDPSLIANGVKNEQEALEVYLFSCSAIDIDHFMERSYLDALALALKIPTEVKAEIEAQVKSNLPA